MSVLEREMNYGIKFSGSLGSSKLTEDYGHMAMKTASYDLSFEYDSGSYTVTCPDREGQSVALYQQVIQSADGVYNLWGTQYVCRYGANWQIAPECPHYACVDPECLTCLSDWSI